MVASSTGQGDVVSRDNPVAADDLIINGLQMNTAYDVTTKYKVTCKFTQVADVKG